MHGDKKRRRGQTPEGPAESGSAGLYQNIRQLHSVFSGCEVLPVVVKFVVARTLTSLP